MYQNRIVRPSRFHTLTMLLIKNAPLLTSLSVVQFLYLSVMKLRSLLPLLFPARSANKPRQVCEKVPREQCKDVPRQECKSVPRQKCDQV